MHIVFYCLIAIFTNLMFCDRRWSVKVLTVSLRHISLIFLWCVNVIGSGPVGGAEFMQRAAERLNNRFGTAVAADAGEGCKGAAVEHRGVGRLTLWS